MDSIDVMKSRCEVFNSLHPVGSPVTYINDVGKKIVTEVKHQAEVLQGHTAVVWIRDITGCVILHRVIG